SSFPVLLPPTPLRLALSPLSLHVALPIFNLPGQGQCQFKLRLPASPSHSGQYSPWHLADGIVPAKGGEMPRAILAGMRRARRQRSEEHTSELQSQLNLVCRLLLEKT